MPLLDRFGRLHTNLRVSVTDRCNIRCFYCMPAENVQFRPKSEILSFEEIEADLQKGWTSDLRTRYGDWAYVRPFAREAYARRKDVADA